MNYIHIAGTNAKGSVSEYIYQILMAEGYSCGIFTSPHLFSPAERFRMNGQIISCDEYHKYMQEAGGEQGEHMFRKWTRAALAWFEDNGLEYAVIEAGIGGSKDSTNVVDAKIAVLTPISLDHTKILGDTIEKIARDKSGIIKPGATVITFGQKNSVMRIIEAVCKKQGARLVVAQEPAVLHTG
ncbi:MAG: Mur ligase family protein, partial [Eubacteriales bacterium]